MLMVVAVAGFGGYYKVQKQTMAEETLADARAELTTVKERAASSEDHAIAARAELARAQASLSETRVGMSALEQRRKEKTQAADELAARLEGIVGKDQGEVVSENGQLTLRLLDRVLFRSGEAELTDHGRAVIASVGAALAEVPDQQVWVQGHTDAAPIERARRQFASNWELSAARALTVVHHLETMGKIDPRRLARWPASTGRPRCAARPRTGASRSCWRRAT
jgi:chemotaxis protein MotB